MILAAVFPLPVAQGAGEKDVVSPPSDEPSSASHTPSFETPTGWTLSSKRSDLQLTEAGGEDLIGRILRRQGELGLAFVIEYDVPVGGEQKWRQRNLTPVNDNGSVCVARYTVSPFGKRTKRHANCSLRLWRA
jgi:hypothetical protein